MLAGLGLLLPRWFDVDLAPAELPVADRRVVHRRRACASAATTSSPRSRCRSCSRCSRCSCAPASASRCAALRRDADRAALARHPGAPARDRRVGARGGARVPGGVPPRRDRRAADRHRARPGDPAARARGGGDRRHGAPPDHRGRRDRARHRRAVGGVGLGPAPATWSRCCSSIVLVALLVTPAGPRAARSHRAVDVARGARAAAGAARARAPARGARSRDVGLVRAGRRSCSLALPLVLSREPHQPRRGRGDLRGHRAVAGRAHRLGAARSASGRWRSSPSAPRSAGRSPRAGAGTSALGLLGAGLVGAAAGHADRPAGAATARAHARRRSRWRSRWRPPRGCSTRSIFGEGTRFDWLPPPRIERPDLFGVIDVRARVALLLPLPRRRWRSRSSRCVGIRRSRGPDACSIAIRENERAAERRSA